MKKKLIFLTLLFILLSSFCMAQEGSITGTVQDKNFKNLEGVQVTIEGSEKVCITDSTGLFYFPNLEPATYSLNFYLKGYVSQKQTILVPEGQNRIVMAQMTQEGSNNTSLSSGYLLYITNLGFIKTERDYNGTSPWGTGVPDTSGSGINTDIANLFGFDPVSDAYKNTMDWLSSKPSSEDLNIFIQYAFKKINNLMIINSSTRGAVSIIEKWGPSVMPQWVDIDEKGYVYVADSDSNITVINSNSNNNVISTLHMGDAIWDIAVGNSGTRLYCATGNAVNPSVGVIDTNTNSFITSITLPRLKNGAIGQPWGIGTFKNGSAVYVTLGNDTGGEVVFINGQTNSIRGSVPVGNNPFGLAVTPDGKKVYAANQNSASVSVIDTVMSKVIGTINVGYSPTRVAVTPDGKKVLVTNKASNSVSVIDTMTDTVCGEISVGKEPIGVAVSGDGKMAFVTNSKSDNVSMIDLNLNSVVNSTIPFPGGNPYDIVVK